MRGLVRLVLAAALVLAAPPPVLADETMIEDFTMQPETRWRFFTRCGDGRRVVWTSRLRAGRRPASMRA